MGIGRIGISGEGARGRDFYLPTQGFFPEVKLMDYSGIITVDPVNATASRVFVGCESLFMMCWKTWPAG